MRATAAEAPYSVSCLLSPEMLFCVLGSGSRGNATYVEGDSTGVLIDAGFSGREVEGRLEAAGVGLGRLAAILVTHEHGDHLRGVGVLARRHRLPVYISPATLAAASGLGRVPEVREIAAGASFTVGSLEVHPFSVSHDAADPLGFVLSHRGRRVGYCTDTGHVSRLIRHRLAACQGLVLEANHDPVMLKNGPYPPELKQRIASRQGHLSNQDAVDLLCELAARGGGPARVVLAHMSGENNHPDAVMACVRGAPLPDGVRVWLARQDEVGEVIRL